MSTINILDKNLESSSDLKPINTVKNENIKESLESSSTKEDKFSSNAVSFSESKQSIDSSANKEIGKESR